MSCLINLLPNDVINIIITQTDNLFNLSLACSRFNKLIQAHKWRIIYQNVLKEMPRIVYYPPNGWDTSNDIKVIYGSKYKQITFWDGDIISRRLWRFYDDRDVFTSGSKTIEYMFYTYFDKFIYCFGDPIY